MEFLLLTLSLMLYKVTEHLKETYHTLQQYAVECSLAAANISSLYSLDLICKTSTSYQRLHVQNVYLTLASDREFLHTVEPV